jgi:hypothetical protein
MGRRGMRTWHEDGVARLVGNERVRGLVPSGLFVAGEGWDVKKPEFVGDRGGKHSGPGARDAGMLFLREALPAFEVS